MQGKVSGEMSYPLSMGAYSCVLTSQISPWSVSGSLDSDSDIPTLTALVQGQRPLLSSAYQMQEMGDGHTICTESDPTPLIQISAPWHFLLLVSVASVLKTDPETPSSFSYPPMHGLGYNFLSPLVSNFCLPSMDFLICLLQY